MLPGDAKTGVKDPVIVYYGGLWHLWASATRWPTRCRRIR